MHVISCSVMPDSMNLWTVAHQAPLPVEFSKQEYWSRLLCPPPGDLPDPGIELTSLCLLYWSVDSLLLGHLANPTKLKVPFLWGGVVFLRAFASEFQMKEHV